MQIIVGTMIVEIGNDSPGTKYIRLKEQTENVKTGKSMTVYLGKVEVAALAAGLRKLNQ